MAGPLNMLLAPDIITHRPGPALCGVPYCALFLCSLRGCCSRSVPSCSKHCSPRPHPLKHLQPSLLLSRPKGPAPAVARPRQQQQLPAHRPSLCQSPCSCCWTRPCVSCRGRLCLSSRPAVGASPAACPWHSCNSCWCLRRLCWAAASSSNSRGPMLLQQQLLRSGSLWCGMCQSQATWWTPCTT